MRTQEIYDITKKEISEGTDIHQYIPIMYGLIKEEDYEAVEGIRLAISDLGIQLHIPETDDEMDRLSYWISNKTLKSKEK